MGYPIRNSDIELAHAYKRLPSEVDTYTLSQKELQKLREKYPTRKIKKPITVNLSYQEIKQSHGMKRVQEGVDQGFSDVEISERYHMSLRVVRRFMTILRRQEVI
jgi:hypothetical protein